MAKKEEATENKSFQIKMEPRAHALLKQRAQQIQITIGELIQNLLASMEKRIERLKKDGEFDEAVRNDALDSALIKILMQIDEKSLSKKEATRKLKCVRLNLQYKHYKPKITIATTK